MASEKFSKKTKIILGLLVLVSAILIFLNKNESLDKAQEQKDFAPSAPQKDVDIQVEPNQHGSPGGEGESKEIKPLS